MSSEQKRKQQFFCDVMRSEGTSEANKCINQKKDSKQLSMERAWESTDKLEEQVNVEKKIN